MPLMCDQVRRSLERLATQATFIPLMNLTDMLRKLCLYLAAK